MRLLCPWNFPDKNTGVGCYFLLQGIFLTQVLKPHPLHLLHWWVDSLPLAPHEKHIYVCVCVCIHIYIYCIYCFLFIFRKLPIKCMFANYVVMNLVNVQTHLIMGTIGDSSPTYTEQCREVIIQQCSLKVFLWWGGQSLCRWKRANQPHWECLWSIQYWLQFLYLTWGFPESSVVKESSCNAGDLGLIPGSGRSAGEGIGYHSGTLGLPCWFSW